MGTRNLTVVQFGGKYKVAQYGQWDGYPEGQGSTVLKFLKEVDLNAFKKRLKSVSFLTKKESGAIDKECEKLGNKWVDKYPQLSRDRGAEILGFIMTGKCEVRDIDYNNPETFDRKKVLNPELKNGKIKLANSMTFAADSLFCEWAYVIDLDKNVLEVYKGFNKEPLAKTERFAKLKLEENPEYHQIRLLKTYLLSDLPSIKQMVEDCDPKEDEE